jgi:hypothetical protein
MKVVVCAVDVASDEPACGAADEDVGGEVLLCEDAADADASGGAVDDGSGEPAWVFFADDGGHGPGGCGVVGREGGFSRAGVEEVSFCVVDEGTVAAGDELDDFSDGKRVDEGLSGKDGGFVGLRGVVVQAPQVHAGGECAECHSAGVRESREVLLVLGADVDVLRHGVLVATDEYAGGNGERQEPFCVQWADVERAGPDGFLVGEQAAWGAGECDVFRLG